jgi:hypothetical protein
MTYLDLAISRDGNVVWEFGDLKLVEDEEKAFEQRLMLWVQYKLNELIGQSLSHEEMIKRLKTQAGRVAKEFNGVDRIVNFTAIRESPKKYRINVVYSANVEKTLEFMVNEGD